MTDITAQPRPVDQVLKAGVLARNVKIEPLVDRWYAWTHLLCPVQQALNLTFRYLPIARSFVANPAVHIAAAEDPTMFGGPFLSLPLSAVDAVRRYVAQTEVDRAEALSLAQALRDFETRLKTTSSGYSLDEFRTQTPTSLSGRIELSYDRHSQPGLRILEEMFDRDDLGLSRAQGVLLNTDKDVDRPFFLSTPRLSAPGSLYVGRPFGDAAIQALCTARQQAVDVAELASSLDVAPEHLAKFFEPEGDQDKPDVRAPESGVRVRYFGHACLLIETPSTSILVDPTFAMDRLDDTHHLTFADLPARIDVLLISHGHQDHFLPEVLMQIRDRVGVVLIPPSNRGELADPSLKRMLMGLGYRSIVTLDPLDVYDLPDGRITALPFSGEHCDLDVHSKQCALVELRGKKICLFVDSDAIDIETYRRLAPLLDKPDIMFVGMECFGAPLSWLYGPLLPAPTTKRNDNSRRMSGADRAKAWRLAEAIKPQRAFVYAMGQERWMRFLMGLNYTEDSVQLTEAQGFVAQCRDQGIEAGHLNTFAEIVL